MAVERQEIETYFGKCKCCLNYGYLRTMWEEHVEDNKTEVYGQMLTQCFSISWTIQGREDDDQICEDCIWKLREAYTFKEKVLQNQKQLHDEEVLVEEIKQEPDDDFVVEYLDEDILEKKNADHEDSDDESQDFEDKESQDEDDISFKDEDDISFKDDEDDKDYDENQNPQDDDDDFIPDKPVLRKRKAPKKADDSSDEENPKPKWPKKLPVEDRSKTYKQYTEENLKSAVDAVIAKTMNQRTAAKKFRIPRKTLSAKVLAVRNHKEVYSSTNTHSRKFIAEVKTLLSHTNVTPFRSRANNHYCFYCKGRTTFSNPKELRDHTQAQHDRTSRLEFVMRPLWKYESIKLDVKDPVCTICDISLKKWSDILEHLKTAHGIKFEYQDRMIPYVLDTNRACVFCGKKFSAFMLLDAHLNTHLRNYVCGHCGEPFVSSQRLKAHEKIHGNGRYPCYGCDKVFKRELYMKKHAIVAHSNELKVKCHHCSEMFKSEHHRQGHIVKHHREHVETISCEQCGMVFDWMRNFMRHMKKAHGTEHLCNQCGKFFESEKLLKKHEVKHTGVKEFKCLVCFKKYYSLSSMKCHLKYAHKNVIVVPLMSK